MLLNNYISKTFAVAVLILCGICCSSANALAQTQCQRELDLGLTGGTIMSQMDFSPTVSQDMAMGYTFGVMARYIEEKYCGLQVGLLVSRRGFKDRYTEYPEYHYQRNLTYLEVPFLAHIYFNAGKRNQISVDLGPKLGMMLWENTDTNLPADFGTTGSSSRLELEHHNLGISNSFDYGIQAGLGYEFFFSKDYSLQLSGSYYFGLGNIFPDEKKDTFEKSANQHIMITMTLYWHKFLKNRW